MSSNSVSNIDQYINALILVKTRINKPMDKEIIYKYGIELIKIYKFAIENDPDNKISTKEIVKSILEEICNKLRIKEYPENKIALLETEFTDVLI